MKAKAPSRSRRNQGGGADAPRAGFRTQVDGGHFHRNVVITAHRGKYTAFGYQSDRALTRDGRVAGTGSGDSHLLTSRARLVDQARDFQRNNGIFDGMVDRAASYVVGSGFGLQARTGDDKLNVEIERAWREEFWNLPEVRGLDSGPEIEKLIACELMTCGEVAAIKQRRGLIQLVESEQIVGKGAGDDGIRKDEFGRPQSFSVAPWGDFGAVDRARGRPISADDVLFLVHRRRPSQTRGIPPLQAVFPMLHRINDMCDSEALAAQMLARFAVAVNRKDSIGAVGFGKSDPDLAGADTSGRMTDWITELDYALILHGDPGDEIRGIDRNIPGKDFPQSVTMFLRLLGLPLGLPLEIILLDWTKSNYSQSRAVLEQAYVTFLRWQIKLRDFFHRPAYTWKLQQWIEEDRFPDREDIFRHEWITPTFPWIDQLKEAQAYGAKVDRTFCTHAQVLKSLGRDREETLDAREREVVDAINRAKRIETETGVAVPWQPFAGLEIGGGPSPAPAPAPPAGDAEGGVTDDREEGDGE